MPSPTRISLAAASVAVALAATGCGGSSKPPTTTAPPASHAAASASKQTGALSGTWAGQYGGAYAGTFNLNWTQSGSSLTGRIKLSAPADTLPINGTVNGGAIKFGTVGSVAITYSGTVSGSAMSGSYQTPGGGGSWSAGKA
jgi:hypothetical protein